MQKFNVLCVTQRDSVVPENTDKAEWHIDIQGQLTIEAVMSVEMGIPLIKTVATFVETSGTQHTGQVLYVRSGLDSMSTTIAIHTSNDRFPCMELYTDMPTTDHPQPAEEIRRMAKLTVAGRRGDFYKRAS